MVTRSSGRSMTTAVMINLEKNSIFSSGLFAIDPVTGALYMRGRANNVNQTHSILATVSDNEFSAVVGF